MGNKFEATEYSTSELLTIRDAIDVALKTRIAGIDAERKLVAAALGNARNERSDKGAKREAGK